ncbi:CAMK family protein kinase [Tritrichomonas foetus]|uniref:CAMK family protein kinase n=1 Tax=Tritrichomonas foetus TaxID=1144522 RepID=A0A1J4J726_9EUKA|nr:CAMK family protein kinase [Tritrichomonas foetus]|eukprot:OHS92996.1 CAMK family protein kinase [Tritrichomonas foetus]
MYEETSKIPDSRTAHFSLALENRGFELLSEIGHGSFANVYLISSKKHQMRFVAKVIDLSRTNKSGLSDTFKSEIYSLTQLIHPNIISIFDHFIFEDCLFLILEYCPGGTLNDYLKANGPIPKQTLYVLAYEMLLSLHFCQKRGIAHRDIKPSNIFIDKYGRAKLADFGFATMNEKICETYAGSLPFMPLEILHLSPYDPMKADIWSLGITFYLMATGTLPYLPKSANNLAMLIATREPFYSELIEKEFAVIIKSMLRSNPQDRASIDSILETPLFKKVRNEYKVDRNSKNPTLRRCRRGSGMTPINNMNIPKIASVGSVGSISFSSKKSMSPLMNKSRLRPSFLQTTFYEVPDSKIV